MKKKSYLNLITIVVAIVASIILIQLGSAVISMTKRGLIEQRFITLQEMLDTRCVETNTIAVNDWEENYERYMTRLCVFFSEIDKHHMVFSAVYDRGLHLLSERQPRFPGQPFDPLKYPEVVKLFETEYSGTIEVLFNYKDDNEKMAPCPMKLYFRRVPENEPDKYLIVTIAQDLLEGDVDLPNEFYILFVTVFSIAGFSVAFLILAFTRYLHPRYIPLYSESKIKGDN